MAEQTDSIALEQQAYTQTQLKRLYNYEAPLPKELFLLDPDVVFLNHGSAGACPRPVFEKYQWWQRELERQPIRFFGRLSGLLRESREKLADYLHTSEANIAYVTNVTLAINILARSIPLKPGDEILTTDHEYGAMNSTWEFICRKTGAVYKRNPVQLPLTTADAFVQEFWRGVSERTRVIFLSHITSPTALTFPVAEICRRARAAGILSIVDGAHSLGQLPLSVEDIGADFYTSNCHKWLCAPKGSAFLYARPQVQHLIEPLIVGPAYNPQRPDASQFARFLEHPGTRDPSAFLTVPEAINFLRQHDWDRVRLQCHALAQQVRQRIGELTGLPALSPDSTEWYMQMVALPLTPCDASRLKQRLLEEYHIEVPITYSWNGKPCIRVSCQAYVTQEDIDRLIAALAKLLKEEQTPKT